MRAEEEKAEKEITKKKKKTKTRKKKAIEWTDKNPQIPKCIWLLFQHVQYLDTFTELSYSHLCDSLRQEHHMVFS